MLIYSIWNSSPLVRNRAFREYADFVQTLEVHECNWSYTTMELISLDGKPKTLGNEAYYLFFLLCCKFPLPFLKAWLLHRIWHTAYPLLNTFLSQIKNTELFFLMHTSIVRKKNCNIFTIWNSRPRNGLFSWFFFFFFFFIKKMLIRSHFRSSFVPWNRHAVYLWI